MMAGTLAKLLTLVTTKTGTAVMIVVVLAQAFLLLQPKGAQLDPARADAADRLAEAAAESIATACTEAGPADYLRVARIEGDPGGAIRTRLEAQLETATGSRIIRDTIAADLRDGMLGRLARVGVVSQPRADAWKTPPVTGLSQAVEEGRRTGARFVVFGRVERFHVTGHQPVAAVRLEVADVESGARRMADTFTGSGPMMLASGGIGGRWTWRGFLMKLVGWAVFVGLLPLITAGAWQRVLDGESNAANAMALGGLTALGVALAWALLGFPLSGWFAMPTLLVALALALTWNGAVLALLERRRTAQPFG